MHYEVPKALQLKAYLVKLKQGHCLHIYNWTKSFSNVHLSSNINIVSFINLTCISGRFHFLSPLLL